MIKTIFCATLVAGCVLMPLTATARAQSASQPTTPASPATSTLTAAATPPTAATQPDHASSYYHYGLAKIYEDQAVANGRQDLATQAIEQYKLALEADPDSETLENGLANLYFRLGRIREAVSAAQELINKHPNDVDAHVLLGHVYLRSLGDGQNPQSGEMLQAAIKEYQTIAKLKPEIGKHTSELQSP